MTETTWLDEPEARAWRGYLRMRALLDLQISRDLARECELSEADYHVLATLSVAPDQQLRLTDLAGGMSWSTSRLAHHLTRMQGRGLVQREPHPTNRRAAVFALTSAGQHVIRAAAPLHVASVRRNFTDLLTRDQIEALAAITETVAGHLQQGSAPEGNP